MTKEAVILFPGCVTFTHKSFFDYCETVADSYNQPSIKVYVHTWEQDFNLDYLNALKEEFKSRTKLKLVLITEPYNSVDFISFLNNIEQGKLTLAPFIKKFVLFYSITRLLEHINQDNPNTVVHKVRSGLYFDCKDNIADKLEYYKTDLRFYIKPETYQQIDDSNLLWTKSQNEDGVSEVLLIGSTPLLISIFGKDVLELSSKLKLLWERYKNDNKSLSVEDLILKEVFPFSGPLLLKELIQLTGVKITTAIFPLLNYTIHSISPVNPLVWLDDENKVHTINERSIPYRNRKGLILKPNESDYRDLDII